MRIKCRKNIILFQHILRSEEEKGWGEETGGLFEQQAASRAFQKGNSYMFWLKQVNIYIQFDQAAATYESNPCVFISTSHKCAK